MIAGAFSKAMSLRFIFKLRFALLIEVFYFLACLLWQNLKKAIICFHLFENNSVSIKSPQSSISLKKKNRKLAVVYFTSFSVHIDH